jgi:hypothetical protein
MGNRYRCLLWVLFSGALILQSAARGVYDQSLTGRVLGRV